MWIDRCVSGGGLCKKWLKYVMNWYLAMLLSEIVNEEVNAFVLSILHKVAKKIFRLKLTSTIVHPKNDFVETSVTILLLVFVVNIINDIFNVLHDMGLQSMFLL